MSGTVFEGGRIHVGDGTSAEALLARDGRVAAVGRRDEVRRAAGAAESVDLRGGMMVPGWFDAHVHFVWWAQQMARLDVADTTTLEQALDRVASFARAAEEVEPVIFGVDACLFLGAVADTDVHARVSAFGDRHACRVSGEACSRTRLAD